MSDEQWLIHFCLSKEPNTVSSTDWQVESLCVCWGEWGWACSWYGSTGECVMWCDGSVTLPQHELVACNGSGAGAGENLTHVLHQTQAVLCVQPEAVWQLPLLDTGRALSYSFDKQQQQRMWCQSFSVAYIYTSHVKAFVIFPGNNNLT